MKKLTLREAREKGKLKEFADQHKSKGADERQFKDMLKRMEKRAK